MICEALVLELADVSATATGIVRRRCRKHATGRVGGLSLCTHHVGMLFLYGEIDAEADEPGYVRRLTVETNVERIDP